MTKLEELMNEFYYTKGLTLEQQFEINKGLKKQDSIDEYEKFFRWLNEKL